MEIDITKFMAMSDEDLMDFSASVAELGRDAGVITWDNAMGEAEREPLVNNKEDLASVRAYIEEFGAWDAEEIAAWSDREVNALLVQLIAGDIRERNHYVKDDRLEEYEESVGGRINRDGEGQWWYYIGM